MHGTHTHTHTHMHTAHTVHTHTHARTRTHTRARTGKYVDMKDTISGFKGILNGEYDDLPEMAFYMVRAPRVCVCTCRVWGVGACVVLPYGRACVGARGVACVVAGAAPACTCVCA